MLRMALEASLAECGASHGGYAARHPQTPSQGRSVSRDFQPQTSRESFPAISMGAMPSTEPPSSAQWEVRAAGPGNGKECHSCVGGQLKGLGQLDGRQPAGLSAAAGSPHHARVPQHEGGAACTSPTGRYTNHLAARLNCTSLDISKHALPEPSPTSKGARARSPSHSAGKAPAEEGGPERGRDSAGGEGAEVLPRAFGLSEAWDDAVARGHTRTRSGGSQPVSGGSSNRLIAAVGRGAAADGTDNSRSTVSCGVCGGGCGDNRPTCANKAGCGTLPDAATAGAREGGQPAPGPGASASALLSEDLVSINLVRRTRAPALRMSTGVISSPRILRGPALPAVSASVFSLQCALSPAPAPRRKGSSGSQHRSNTSRISTSTRLSAYLSPPFPLPTPTHRTRVRAHTQTQTGCTNAIHRRQELVQGLMNVLECSCCLASMGAEQGVPLVAYNCGTRISSVRKIATFSGCGTPQIWRARAVRSSNPSLFFSFQTGRKKNLQK